MEKAYKTGIKQLFIALQKSCIAKETYKYSNFRNQEPSNYYYKEKKNIRKL